MSLKSVTITVVACAAFGTGGLFAYRRYEADATLARVVPEARSATVRVSELLALETSMKDATSADVVNKLEADIADVNSRRLNILADAPDRMKQPVGKVASYLQACEDFLRASLRYHRARLKGSSLRRRIQDWIDEGKADPPRSEAALAHRQSRSETPLKELKESGDETSETTDRVRGAGDEVKAAATDVTKVLPQGAVIDPAALSAYLGSTGEPGSDPAHTPPAGAHEPTANSDRHDSPAGQEPV